MNKIFKTKLNSKGQSVVTAEFSRNKGKMSSATVVLSALLGLYSTAFATPVSEQGHATSENAVSIGSNSYATSIDGVANGQGAIATGQGFNRSEFATKVQENQNALTNVENALLGINQATNNITANDNAIKSLSGQIDDLSKQQANIADKLSQKERLDNQKSNLNNLLTEQNNTLISAQASLATLSNNGKNQYLNFTDVLKSLNWNVLSNNTDSDAARNTVAGELKQKIESNFADFSGKYTASDYRAIVDGYINRQASYQGSYEYLNSQLGNDIKIVNGNTFFNKLYYNTNLDSINYAVSDNYSVDKDNQTFILLDYGTKRTAPNPFGNYVRNDSTTSNAADSWEARFNSSQPNYFQENKQNTLNTLTLAELSLAKSKKENHYTSLLNAKRLILFLYKDNYDKTLLNLSIGERNLTDVYNDLVLKRYASSQLQFGLKTTTGNNADPYRYDGNIGILTKLKDFSVNNTNLISTNDIAFFKNFYQGLQAHSDSIDWDFAESAINLPAYRTSLDKVIAYNSKINTVLDLYQSIINERKKADADASQIDTWTVELMKIKQEVLDGVQDTAHFVMGMDLVYNKQWADHYLYYAKDEADAMIRRINNELKLYNENDRLIVEATSKAKEIQANYEAAKNNVDNTQAELDRVNKQIADLALTAEEQAVDDIKAKKQAELDAARTSQVTLATELERAKSTLKDAEKQLANTSLKDLGLKSQAYGSNAFASGDYSIAIGSNTSVTANDGIAVGRDSSVTGDKSTAIGVMNTVSGTGNFVAGHNNRVDANNTVVIGNHIEVEAGVDGGVVLGHRSQSASANPIESIVIGGKTYQFAGVSPTSTVSIGATGEERQITHVAAGRIANSSTDAINGSQLYAVIASLSNIKPIGIGSSLNISDGVNNTQLNHDLSLNVVGKDGVQTVLEGNNLTISYTDPTNVIGDKYIRVDKQGNTFNLNFNDTALTDLNNRIDNIKVNGEASTFTLSDENGKKQIIGDGDTVKLVGDNKNITTTLENGVLKVALKDDVNVHSVTANAVNVGDVVIDGNGINAGNKTIENVTRGKISPTSQQAVNGSQLYETNQNLTQLGNKVETVNQRMNTVEEKVEQGIYFVGNDGQTISKKLGETLELLGELENQAEASARNVRVDNNNGKLTVKVADRPTFKEVKAEEKVSVGKVSLSAKDGIYAGHQKVKGVAAGEISPNSTEAINGSQLYTTNTQVIQNAQDIDNLKQKTDKLDNKINGVEKRARKGIAIAGALGMLPQPHLSGKSLVSAATTHYRGEQALAVGYSRLSDNSKHIIKFGASSNLSGKKDAMLGASYGYQW